MKKKCTGCGLVKDVSDFYKNATDKGGYQSKCKECFCLVYKKKRAEKKEFMEQMFI